MYNEVVCTMGVIESYLLYKRKSIVTGFIKFNQLISHTYNIFKNINLIQLKNCPNLS